MKSVRFVALAVGWLIFASSSSALTLLAGEASVAAESTSVDERVTAPCLNGAWSGTWVSCGTGHRGPLQASICQIDGCHYRVKFKGRFLKVIPFHYSTTLTATGIHEGQVTLYASERLGLLLGTFTMQGSANSSQFVAHYRSKDDQGRFVLQRSN